MNEVLRQEKKFLIGLPDYYYHSGNLAKFMLEDPHNRGDGYPIRSLYFDSLEDRDFQEKMDGVAVRRKIRLRCYGPNSDFALLEVKQKEANLQKKRSLRLSRDAAVRLAQGDYGVLLSLQEPLAQECYAIMNIYGYQPHSVVEYRRRAFIARENKIRVTFDHHITGTESGFDIFDSTLPQYPVQDTSLVVLEVKYNGFLLSYIKDMLSNCAAGELSVSKYCLSRTVGKHFNF